MRAPDPGAPAIANVQSLSPKESDMTLLELDTGNTAWVLTSAALVLLMTPGLALFYGGMVRAKSVLNMMMMSFGALALISVLWVLYGYSISFGDDVGAGLLGNPLQYLGLKGLMEDTDASLPAMAFVAFQAVFAIITVALISGAIADRAKFGTWMIFAGIWATVVLPGRSLGLRLHPHRRRRRSHPRRWLDRQQPRGDRLRRRHRGAYQRRCGGSRVGSHPGQADRLEARSDAAAQPHPRDDRRRPAVVRLVRLQRRLGRPPTTPPRSCGSTPWWRPVPPPWLLTERLRDGHATSLGAASGIVAGLVAITACAPRSARSARSSWGLAGVFCALAVGLKYKFGYDDSLDVVGVHLIGGLWGTLAVVCCWHWILRLESATSAAACCTAAVSISSGAGRGALACCSSAWC